MFCIQGLGWSAVFFARVSVLFPASDKDPTVEGLLKAPLIYTGSKKVLQSLVRGYLGSLGCGGVQIIRTPISKSFNVFLNL